MDFEQRRPSRAEKKNTGKVRSVSSEEQEEKQVTGEESVHTRLKTAL
jgi:hypothetical protein